MGVTAELHRQTGVGERAEIRRHDGGRAPVEAERGFEHAAVADGHQLRDAAHCLFLQKRHRV